MISQIQPINILNKPIQTTKADYSLRIVPKTHNYCTDTFESQKLSEKDNSFSISFKSNRRIQLKGLKIQLGNILESVGEQRGSLSKMVERLETLVTKDDMTGLFNRKFFDVNLVRQFNEARKAGKSFSVGYIDMDNFKGINEVLGHDVGDIVLKRMAAHIQSATNKHRLTLIPARYGGEEFVIAMPEHNAESATQIMKEIADAIKSDKEIQKYLPEFKKKAEIEQQYLTQAISPLDRKYNSDSIFRKIGDRSGNPVTLDKCESTAQEIIDVINQHIKKYQPENTQNLDIIINMLRGKSPEELQNILKTDTVVNGNSTLGNELNNIYTQYKGKKDELDKWITHIDRYTKFTISGGVADEKTIEVSDDGKCLLIKAEKASRAAKQAGKNQITQAPRVNGE